MGEDSSTLNQLYPHRHRGNIWGWVSFWVFLLLSNFLPCLRAQQGLGAPGPPRACRKPCPEGAAGYQVHPPPHLCSTLSPREVSPPKEVGVLVNPPLRTPSRCGQTSKKGSCQAAENRPSSCHTPPITPEGMGKSWESCGHPPKRSLQPAGQACLPVEMPLG